MQTSAADPFHLLSPQFAKVYELPWHGGIRGKDARVKMFLQKFHFSDIIFINGS
jgi:hypothetical protein